MMDEESNIKKREIKAHTILIWRPAGKKPQGKSKLEDSNKK